MNTNTEQTDVGKAGSAVDESSAPVNTPLEPLEGVNSAEVRASCSAVGDDGGVVEESRGVQYIIFCACRTRQRNCKGRSEIE